MSKEYKLEIEKLEVTKSRDLKSLRRSGKIPGICCFNTGMTKKWLSKGALFVTSGADISFMMEGSNTTLKELRR